MAADTLFGRPRKETSYREQALQILPWVCAKCGREFSGRRLKELTVHHKDHNHHNNPVDGSNWELLCLYCHDDEHGREEVADWYNHEASGSTGKASGLGRPFAGLASLLKKEEKV